MKFPTLCYLNQRYSGSSVGLFITSPLWDVSKSEPIQTSAQSHGYVRQHLVLQCIQNMVGANENI